MTRHLTRLLLILALALPGAHALAGQDGAAASDLLVRLLEAPDATAQSAPAGARSAQVSTVCGGSFRNQDGALMCCKMDETVSCRNGVCRCSYSSTCAVSCAKAGTCLDRPCRKR